MYDFRFLSHPLGKVVPAYGDKQAEITIEQIKSISNGDSCNIFWVGLGNHLGTHIDGPAHFFNQGTKISDYSAKTWFFSHPFVLNLELQENEVVELEDISSVPEGADLILIKSGFQRFRGTGKYSYHNPGIRPEVGLWLRKEHLSVRAIGFDFVSISPYQKRDLGQEAHRAFLDPQGINNPLFIIEDMNLSGDITELSHVWVVPFLIEGIDSAPCTVIGGFERKGVD